jgi:hypothetical protein
MVSNNRTPQTHGLVEHLAQPNLTLNTVSHNQQNSTNPWIGWAFSQTWNNPEYCQSQPTELHQPMDLLGI